jgi:hypothetical protein
MNILASLVILTALGNVATTAHHPDAVTLYQCGFEQEADEDYDNWPDGWTRRRGTGFPHYLPMQIRPESENAAGRCMWFDFGGGGAAAYSPAIAIDPRHDYVLHARLATRQLVHDRAWLSIVFLNKDRQPLETLDSEKVGAVEGWLAVRLGPVRCSNPAARWAKIALVLEPGAKQDLHGAALFDDLWFAQVPRLELQITERHLLYPVGEPIEVRCRVSGYRDVPPDVQLALHDSLGEELARHRLPLNPLAPAAPASAKTGDLATDYRVAEADWILPVAEPGYYSLHATVSHEGVVLYQRELRLAVTDAMPRPEQGEFGWTLPSGEQSLSLTTVAQWASQAGVYWIKFPLWYDEQDRSRVEGLTWFADRLNSHGIGLIGLLCNPPPETRRVLALMPGAAVANLFAQDVSRWYPSLEPVMARLSLKVRWWQLGRDDDSSLSGVLDPVSTISRVKTQLDQIGQNAHVGVVWNWFDTVPTGKNSPWTFISRSSDPTLAADELAEYLSAEKQAASTWLSLDPLDPARYDATTRAADLVLRLVTAKEHGITKIFFNHPLDGQAGLIREDGSANDLLLPWRTTAIALSGATYLGRLQLAGGSENRLFIRAGQVMAVVWNSVPTTEPIDFGEHLRVTDVWGRVRDITNANRGAALEVGPLPVFVSGLSEAVARWRMSVATDRDRLPSVSGTPHFLRLKWRNYFDQSAGGKLRVIAPADWRVVPEVIDLKMAAGESAVHNLELVVPPTASCGHEWLRFEFDVHAGQPYHFSVRRPIELGLGDVYMVLTSHLNAAGELEVEQRTINRTDERVSFRCHLSVPNRRRMRTQIWKQPSGEDVQTYRLPFGEQLIGQTLRVQAEEVGGKRRMLNYQFIAEP